MARNELVFRAAPGTPQTMNSEKRTLEATIATSNPVRVFDWDRGEIDEILTIEGARFPDSVPLLDSHDRSGIGSVVGSVRNFRTESGRIAATVSFADTASGRDAAALYAQGHARDFSVGYRIDQERCNWIEPDEEKEVNGRKYRSSGLPLRVVGGWDVREVSCVAIGADPAAKARAENNRSLPPVAAGDVNKEKTMAENIETKVEQKREEIAPASPPPSESVKPVTVDVDAERQAAITAERQRVAAIQKEAEGIEGAEVLVREAVEKGESVEQVRGKLLAHVRGKLTKAPTGAAPAIHIAPEVNRAAVESWLMGRCGMEQAAVKQHGEQAVEQGRRMRDWTMQDMAEWCLRSEGKAVGYSRSDRIRAAFSTISLPYMLGAVANKSAVKGYESIIDNWEKIASPRDVANLQTQTLVRFADKFTFAKVGPGGEIAHSQADEEYEQGRAYTYATQFVYTREAMINDDLALLTAIPQELGKRAKIKASDLFWTHLMANGTTVDGYALMGTDHKNLISGTTSVMNASNCVTALDTALVKFLQQTDKKGDYISTMPRYLVVPPELSSVAESVFKGATISTGNGNRTPGVNIHAGKFEVITEPRLSASAYTGYSTTAWYMVADPARIESVAALYVNGQRAPVVEQIDLGGDILGIGYRCYFDFGVKAIDWRGLLKSAGA